MIDKTMVAELELTLTGSRVFSNAMKITSDWDYFGIYTVKSVAALITHGFVPQDYHACYSMACVRLVNIQMKNDVFLFVTQEAYDRYKKVHEICERLKLRDMIPDKPQFREIFDAMIR